MRFTVEIELDDATQSGREIAAVLGRVVHRIEDNLLPLREHEGEIIDVDGNTVAKYAVTA